MEPRTTQEILLTEIRDNVADLEVNLGDVDVNLEALEVINTAITTFCVFVGYIGSSSPIIVGRV